MPGENKTASGLNHDQPVQTLPSDVLDIQAPLSDMWPLAPIVGATIILPAALLVYGLYCVARSLRWVGP
jgi:hypothetical protein